MEQEQQCHQLADEPYMPLVGALANTTATAITGSDPAAAAANEQGYMLVGLQTGGGDKIRLVVVADQSYFFITGYAQGFFSRPRWSFREGERHRLLPSLANGSSHAEVVASNVLAALMNAGKDCF